MATETKTYTIIVTYTQGDGSDVHYAELKTHVKARLTRDLPARKGASKAELVSIAEA